jgi:hypothetical protein
VRHVCPYAGHLHGDATQTTTSTSPERLKEIASRIAALPNALGLVTPLQAFGADFVLTLPGCSRMDIPSSCGP